MTDPYKPPQLDRHNATAENGPWFIIPIAEVAILSAVLGFIFGFIVPPFYARWESFPNPGPLPWYVSWVDDFNEMTLMVMGISAPIFVLILGWCARAVAPPRILRYVPWWRTSFRELARKHRRQNSIG